MTTRHVSSSGIPTSNSAIASACHSRTASDAPIITSDATTKPIGMLPPSPRKMRGGEERLYGRKPRQAPQSAPPETASQASPSTTPRIATAPAATQAIVPAAPSMLSKRLKALTTPAIHRAVTTRSTALPKPRSQPRPTPHRPAAMRNSIPRRRYGERLTRSSVVPTTQSTTAPPTTGPVRSRWPATSSATKTNATMTAEPPRYGVGLRCPL